MPQEVIIRDATLNDATILTRIHIESRAAAMPWLAVMHSTAETAQWISGTVIPQQRVRVATLNNAVVGFFSLAPGWLEQLYVHPEHQNCGTGSLLFNDACRLAVGPFHFWVFQRNVAARRFYERHGCRLLKVTDGLANEEREPDALYEKPNTADSSDDGGNAANINAMTLSTRKAVAADIDYARNLHHAAYREVVAAQFGGWDDRTQDRFFESDWHGASFLILLSDGEPCGYAAVEDRPDDIHVRELVIDTVRQRQGIGSMFLRSIMDRATARRVPVRIGTCLEKRAVKLYHRLGFREFGRSPTHILMEWHGP